MHIHFAIAALGPSSCRPCLATTRPLPPSGSFAHHRTVRVACLPCSCQLDWHARAFQVCPPFRPHLIQRGLHAYLACSRPAWALRPHGLFFSLGVGPKSSDTSLQSSAQRRGPQGGIQPVLPGGQGACKAILCWEALATWHARADCPGALPLAHKGGGAMRRPRVARGPR